MKFEIPDNDIMTVGALKTKAISISANAKAYRLIFGQIYPDIIKAIVRELFTNAWDSQKVAGTLSTPIEIHLPTPFEPWFSIRDFGTGMSEEIIDDVYTRVFESTKDDSDEEAGMFGMGSKTPLGYTDSFAITSYVNGMMYAYSIYINKAGEAELALQYKGETEEPNGVYVQVSVKNEDFDSFKNHAETFALHAGTAININRERVLNTRAELMSGENWTLYEENDKFDDVMYIRMGCVLYRLDTTMMFDNLPEAAGWRRLEYNEQQQIRKLFNMSVIIDFNIGDFQVTGSREDIIYDSVSASKIYYRILNDVVKEIRDQIQFDIKNAKTFGEAYRLGRIYHRQQLLSDKGFRTLQWKSWYLHKADHFLNQRTKADVCYQPYSNRSSVIMRSFVKKSIDPTTLYDPDSTTYVVLDNGESKRVYSRLCNLYTKLIDSGLHKSSYYANIYKVGKPPMFNLLWVNSKKTNLARLQAILPAKHVIIKMEDILTQPPKKREDREEVEVTYEVYHLKENFGDLSITRYETEPKSEYYVRTHRRQIQESEEKIHAACAALGIDVEKVCAINKMSLDCIEHHELLDLIEEADKVRDSITYSESTYFHNVVKELNGRFDKVRYWYKAAKVLALVMGINYLEEDVSSTYVRTVNTTVEATHNAMKDRVVAYIEELYVKYPLLQYVNSSNMSIEENLTDIMKNLGEIV